MPDRGRDLRWGANLLAMSAAGVLGASAAILTDRPDLATRTGRHLVAGALAIAALSALVMTIALIPLRRGERWAFWAAALPIFLVGVPLAAIEARFVPRERRLVTVAPQLADLLLAIAGLTLAARGVFHASETPVHEELPWRSK